MKGWMKIVFAVSLALNLLFIGLMGGKVFHGGKHGSWGGPPKSFIESLSSERAAELRTGFEEIRAQKRADRKDMRSHWAKVRAAMTADPFNKADLESALDAIADLRDTGSRAHNARLADFVSGMSAEERKAYSDAMSERWKNRRERWKKRDRD